MAAVIKDTGEIWSRLFDHRPFVHGEVTYFLREFEERRGDREVERLFKILEYSTDLGQEQLDRAEQLGDYHLPSLKANTDVALSMCERILRRQEGFYTDTKIQENREKRKADWQGFINDMSIKCQKVDQTFKEKEEELREFYVDLEKKLHINIFWEAKKMPVQPIDDPTVTIKASFKLIDFVIKNVKSEEVPANIKAIKKASRNKRSQFFLNLDDVIWLDGYLKKYRESCDERVYIHEFLENVDINLPSPKITPRDPILDARIQKLTAQQNAREYEAMTKGVDATRKHQPEDTIAFQMKEINRQLIAVAQFVFSVLAGFAFGFIGVELLVGNLDFGFRLLLGIICALVIALAEIYFLAKTLNENHSDDMVAYSKFHQE